MSWATKKGYHKGCFGGATLKDRQKAARKRAAARSYARNYIKRRMDHSPAFNRKMEDAERYQAELDRLTRKRLKVQRAKSAEKRTGVGQKR